MHRLGKNSSFLRVYFSKKDYLLTLVYLLSSCKNPLLYRLGSWFLFKPKWPLFSMVIISPALTPIAFLESIKVKSKKIARQIVTLNENYSGTEQCCRYHAGNSSTHRTINYHVPWVIRPPVNLLRMLINTLPSKGLIFTSIKWNTHSRGLHARNNRLFTRDLSIDYRRVKFVFPRRCKFVK